MLHPSFSLSPVAPDFDDLSDPAKSTRLIMEYLAVLSFIYLNKKILLEFNFELLDPWMNDPPRDSIYKLSSEIISV